MLTRFGAWYLATLGPAFMLFWAAKLAMPLDPLIVKIVVVLVSIGMLPFLAVVTTSFMLAFGIDTDRWLPAWYRRLTGLPVD